MSRALPARRPSAPSPSADPAPAGVAQAMAPSALSPAVAPQVSRTPHTFLPVTLAAAALVLAACGGAADAQPADAADSPAASATTAETTDAASTAEAPAKDPQCSGLTGEEAVARWGPELPEFSIEGHSYAWELDYAETYSYDPCAELSWILVDVQGGTASSPTSIMVFHHGQFVGTAYEDFHPHFPRVERVDEGTFTVAYPWSSPDDHAAQRTWAATSTFTWDSASGALVREGELPPASEAEAAERHEQNLATGLPHKINGIFPGAGGPAPADVIDLMPTPPEGRELLAGPQIGYPGVAAMFTTTSRHGIGCLFQEDGQAICGVSSLYHPALYGHNEFGDPQNLVQFAPDGTAEIFGFPDIAVWNHQGVQVPTVQNGEPVRWGDMVCAMADEALTCWNTETGRGAYMGGNRITTF